MNSPRFSIVIPTYNRADLVGYTIQSALRQSFGDLEVVVCDNWSTDNTPEVVRGFTDSRLRYVKPPRHLVIADNFEFGRSHARGDLVIMLADDDALVQSALGYFATAAEDLHSDFLFCRTVEYRDSNFPGPRRNMIDCPPFGAVIREVTRDEYLSPIFACNQLYDMHPSSYFFGRELAERIASRTGRFFQTNGVEYCAWPLAAAVANVIALVDFPLAFCGRTAKSWGSNLNLVNPGPEKIQQFIDDVEQERRHAPLANFTMSNMRAEGTLTAKALLPEEFRGYEYDHVHYLWKTWLELKSRERLGVDVRRELQDLRDHIPRDSDLPRRMAEFEQTQNTLWRRITRWLGDRGLRDVRDRFLDHRTTRQAIAEGRLQNGLRIAGSDFGFQNIIEATDALSRIVGLSAPRSHRAEALLPR